MDNYAVIQIAHKQYIVEPGKTYTVAKFVAEPGSKMKFDVLGLGNGKDFTAGTPNLDKHQVEVEILDQGKGEKVVSRLFHAKSRYRRTRGFRKQETTFKVISIK